MEDTFPLKIDGEVRKIRMTWGLLDALSQHIGTTVEAVAILTIDTNKRRAILNELLSERDADGVITKPVNFFHIDVAPDDIAELLSWAQEHLMDFLVKAATSSKDVIVQLTKTQEDLKSSLNGSAS